MAICAGQEGDQLSAIAARAILGRKIGADRLEAQRHGNGDQVHRRDDNQVVAQNGGSPDLRNERLDQEYKAGPEQPPAENDGGLRRQASREAHRNSGGNGAGTWSGLARDGRIISMRRRNSL